MEYKFTGKLIFADGTVKEGFIVTAKYYKQENTYGNGYYLDIASSLDTPGTSRYYDVRYEIIDDFREFAEEVIKNLWSGKRGSARYDFTLLEETA